MYLEVKHVLNFIKSYSVVDPRNWEMRDVLEWLRWAGKMYNIKNADLDKFRMNGKGLCMLTRNGFLYRVPNGGDLLFRDFQMQLQEASGSCTVPPPHPVCRTQQNVPFPLTQPGVKFPVQRPNVPFSSGHLPVPHLSQPPHVLGPYSPDARSPFEFSRDPNYLFFQF